MQAERMRAEVVAANMANAETTRTASRRTLSAPARGVCGQSGRYELEWRGPGDPGFLESLAGASGMPLRRPGSRCLCLAQAVCASRPAECTSRRWSRIRRRPLKRYDPGHPDAGPDGYVSYPDINPLTEMVDLMGATRAYGLNGSAVQAEKGMITAALEIAKT